MTPWTKAPHARRRRPSLRRLLARYTRAMSAALLLLASPLAAQADETSARLSMRDASNPLLVVFSELGPFYIELYPAQAPRNVSRLLQLVEGEARFDSSDLRYRYYDQTRVHAVDEHRSFRFGAPKFTRFGLVPPPIGEEIDAEALGLTEKPLLNEAAEVASMLGIGSREEFDAQILAPLYARASIEDKAELRQRAAELMGELNSLSVADALENLGHRFTEGLRSPPVSRGDAVLLSAPPGTASTEILIALTASPWLDGRVTPIGKIVEGQDVADEIGRGGAGATQIYSVRRL